MELQNEGAVHVYVTYSAKKTVQCGVKWELPYSCVFFP
jgi:hypothetical protein